jgi:ecdysteroid kinase
MPSTLGYHVQVNPVPPEATPERLTAILRHAGILESGVVVHVAVETSRDTLVSRIARLRLSYAGGADAAPLYVFFKAQREGIDPQWHELGRKEAIFYGLVAAATPAGLLPRCYEAMAEPSGAWHLLLEDLTASHEPVGEWPMPPSIERCRAVIAAHAGFHAAWWDHERLGVSVGAFADEGGALDRYVAALPKDVAAFADRLGDRLSGERKLLYERLIAAAPRLLDRYRSHRHLTLVHGDAHVWNALLPRDAALDDVRLIDWDGWRVDTASDDLAYMLAVHWYPDWRRRHERDSLARYHDALMAAGVRDYSFDALWQDYRLSVLWQITTPVWQSAHALAPMIWWNNLERIMLAVHDLECLELLE